MNARERRERRRDLAYTTLGVIAFVIFAYAWEAHGVRGAATFVGVLAVVVLALRLMDVWIEQPVREPKPPKPPKPSRRVSTGPSVYRKPSFAEMEAAMDTMMKRGRESLITCEEPVAFITSVLAEAMHGDHPVSESRDWFVNTVMTRIESDRYMARQPPLAADRAKWRNEEA